MKQKATVTIFWFRRDLRLDDNAGLFYALRAGAPVLPIFIFDQDILEKLENKYDRRVDYIHQALRALNDSLTQYGCRLNTWFGKPLEVFQQLQLEYAIEAVYCNRDYEPQAIDRDRGIYQYFKQRNIGFKAFKDQVIFDKADIMKNDGTPYTVYTAYANKWKENLNPGHYQFYNTCLSNFHPQCFSEIPSLKEIGFERTDIIYDTPKLDAAIIDEYDRYRDYPAAQRTTGLGIALRFGTVSIRKCVAFALEHNRTWLSELIWREFFMQILYHFPHVVHHAFKKQYDLIEWRNDETEFKLWCEGKTGYPIVDAGMRQLNETGFMHNRVRMIVAGFLCKHLLIDWRWGEAYFAEKLNDYDLASNNGNWQWAAGSGCDAAPFFRIFNPTRQTERFDPELEYIKRWIPEFEKDDYLQPVVEHGFARERALATYNLAAKSFE